MEGLQQKGKVLSGHTASPGIGIGIAQIFQKGVIYAQPVFIKKGQEEEHINLFKVGRAKLKEHFINISEVTHKEADQEIINTYEQILMDIEIETSVKNLISSKHFSADYAIFEAFNNFIELLKDSGSAMFKSRVVDLEEVRDRLINVVCNRASDFEFNKDAILIAEDIGLVDLVTLAGLGLKGLILSKGGATSHAAILAQSFAIPMVFGVKNATKDINDGDQLILDAESAEVWINPNASTIKHAQKKANILVRRERLLSKILRKPSVTASGEEFHLLANLEFESELDSVKKYKAEGVGLLRTESLLFENKEGDHEDVQIEFYRKLLSKTKGLFTIRLFDVGGDKIISKALNEPNPFLGWRGIRVLLDEEYTLKTQLKAVLKVSAEFPGRIKILVPMVSTIDEIIRFNTYLDEIKSKLSETGVSYDNAIEVGIMIEVPSSIIMADDFAPHVDYFSIGTNDLTQYILAVDRSNELTEELYNQRDPAVFKMIKMMVDSAKRNQKSISVCGELAGDPYAAAVLVGLGINSLSMNPHKIPKVKSILTQKGTAELKEFSDLVLSQKTTKDINKLFKNWI